ncbi:hypothetical protein PG984_006964 [Apiospora sp. TS-2023a]
MMDSPGSDLVPSPLADLPLTKPLAMGPPVRRIFLRAMDDADIIHGLIRMLGLPDLEAPGPHGRAAQLALWLFGKRIEDHVETFIKAKRVANPTSFGVAKTELGYPDPQEADERKVIECHLESEFPEEARGGGPSAQPSDVAMLTPPASGPARRAQGIIAGLSPIRFNLPPRSHGMAGSGGRKRQASPGEGEDDQRLGAKRPKNPSGSHESPEPYVLDKEFTQRQPDPAMDLISQLQLDGGDLVFSDDEDSNGNGNGKSAGKDAGTSSRADRDRDASPQNSMVRGDGEGQTDLGKDASTPVEERHQERPLKRACYSAATATSTNSRARAKMEALSYPQSSAAEEDHPRTA